MRPWAGTEEQHCLRTDGDYFPGENQKIRFFLFPSNPGNFCTEQLFLPDNAEFRHSIQNPIDARFPPLPPSQC